MNVEPESMTPAYQTGHRVGSGRTAQIPVDIAHERGHPGITLAAAAFSLQGLPARRQRGKGPAVRRPRLGVSLILPSTTRLGRDFGHDGACSLRNACKCPPRGRLPAQVGEQRRLDVAPHVALPTAGTNRAKKLRDLPVLGMPLRVKPQTETYGRCLHASMVANGDAR